jgi:hypothetical protein
MKNTLKILNQTLILCAAVVMYSCGDSAVEVPKNTGTFSANLKRLDKNVDGVYELWVSIETNLDHGDDAFKSLGRFNVSVSGGLVDTGAIENNFAVNISSIADINTIGDALVTIEPPGDNDTIPSNIRMLGGAKNNQNGVLVFNLTMDYNEILGGIAAQFPNDSAKCVLAAPTIGDTNQYYKGLWFSKNSRSPVAGLTVPFIIDTLDWTYQAWVFDRRNLSWIYNIGRFNAQWEISQISPHPCYQNPPDTVWQLPGEDWIQPNCPGSIPDITDLRNTNYDIVITLEPRFEQGPALSKPFYIQLFKAAAPLSLSYQYGTVISLQNISSSNLPTGVLRLSVNH